MKTLEFMKENLKNAKDNKIKIAKIGLGITLLYKYIQYRIKFAKLNKASADLAYSDPEYNNVFEMAGITEKNTYTRGTAFYIGNNLLMTAAHNFCCGSRVNLSLKECENLRFFEKDHHEKIIKEYHASEVWIHPGYCGGRENDIAIILLKEKVERNKGLILDFCIPSSQEKGITIGYTDKILPRNTFSFPRRGSSLKRRAVIIPEVHLATIDNTVNLILFNVIGYQWHNNYFVKRKEEILENSTQKGMSGGPLIMKNKVVGLCHGIGPSFSTTHVNLKTENFVISMFKKYIRRLKYYGWYILLSIGARINLVGNEIYLTPLSVHETWVKNIIQKAIEENKEASERVAIVKNNQNPVPTHNPICNQEKQATSLTFQAQPCTPTNTTRTDNTVVGPLYLPAWNNSITDPCLGRYTRMDRNKFNGYLKQRP